MKILYVEDNAVNLSLIERIAQMNKHELTSYDEAEIALAALDSGETAPDLILLDIQLAGEMDGIGFAKEVRKRGYQQPIIAITAYAMMGDKERIIAAGCNDYLPKPLPIAEFLTLLAKYDPKISQGKTATQETKAAPAPDVKPTPQPEAKAPPAPTQATAPTPQPEPKAPTQPAIPEPPSEDEQVTQPISIHNMRIPSNSRTVPNEDAT